MSRQAPAQPSAGRRFPLPVEYDPETRLMLPRFNPRVGVEFDCQRVVEELPGPWPLALPHEEEPA